LKPQNIIFHEGEVKISDFGLSKIMRENEDNIELTSQGVGTYWYLPPECFITSEKSVINSKVDIWSLGVIFYEMLYGKRPFAHSLSQERIFKEGTILNAKKVDFPLIPVVSSEAKEFIKKCLQYNIEDRWNVQDAYYSSYIRRVITK
jgi:tousled-like kinase